MLKIQLPEEIKLSSTAFQKMLWNNPELKLQLTNNELFVFENYVEFSKMSFIELDFPSPFTFSDFHALCAKNTELQKVEFHAQKIQIHMAVVGLIGAFTAAVLLSLGIWNRKHKLGELYNESGFIKANPFLIIEIVSNKYGLQQDLQKMAEHWMENGTAIGLVIDPHRSEYHLFQAGHEEYESFSFSDAFMHEKLPELEIDFEQLLQEALEEQAH